MKKSRFAVSCWGRGELRGGRACAALSVHFYRYSLASVLSCTHNSHRGERREPHMCVPLFVLRCHSRMLQNAISLDWNTHLNKHNGRATSKPVQQTSGGAFSNQSNSNSFFRATLRNKNFNLIGGNGQFFFKFLPLTNPLYFWLNGNVTFDHR